MLVVRCTAKLLARLKAKPGPSPPPSTTLLGDWYATVLPWWPAHLVLLVNERTRLAAVLPARPSSTLAKRIPEAIVEILRNLGAAAHVIEQERQAMAGIVFARTASRSVLGTMNEFAFHLGLQLERDEGLDHAEVAMFLNRMYLTPLDNGRPDDVAMDLLDIARRPARRGTSDSHATRALRGAAPIHELRVALCDVTPEIWRRVQVRSSITLASLHRVLQPVMGWTNSHLHDFRVTDVCYGEPHPELPPRKDERKAVLGDLLTKPNDRLTYVYDFGDGWRHDVVLERVIAAEPDCDYPRVIAGARACPPEDCGGISGYAHLLAVLADPRHVEHFDLVDWVGGSFDPEAFDAAETDHLLRHGWVMPRAETRPRTETTLPRSVVIALPVRKPRP